MYSNGLERPISLEPIVPTANARYVVSSIVARARTDLLAGALGFRLLRHWNVLYEEQRAKCIVADKSRLNTTPNLWVDSRRS
jgi:hypothetical protein